MTLNGPQNSDFSGLPAVTYADATAMAQTAFENGWIDVDDLDRRLAGIASASSPLAARAFIADLEEPLSRVRQAQQRQSLESQRNKKKIVAMSIPFYATTAVLALCVVIWSLVALSAGLHYFWPMWLLIPMVLTYPIRYAGIRLHGDGTQKF